uniref:MHD domain-containing protein n=1 Tax=Acrobeloides nanus TaxID=290746 RepID=A0A914DFI2_9BILA
MGGSNSSSANKEDKTISSKQRDISKQIDNENDDLFTQEISYLDTTNNAEKELVYFESTDRSRRRDIKYGRNVIKLDVIEAVNLSTSSDGQVTYAHIDGKIVMNPRLSGMPKCCCHFNSDNRSKHCDKKAKCVNCTQEQT